MADPALPPAFVDRLAELHAAAVEARGKADFNGNGYIDAELAEQVRDRVLGQHTEAILALVEAARHARGFIPTYPERSPAYVAYLGLTAALEALNGD